MKFGTSLLYECNCVGPLAGEVARAAERIGFESLWAGDYPAVPAGLETTYPYREDGKFWLGGAVALPDPLIYLTHAAAVTTHIRIGTSVIGLPTRNPLILAKEVASLDNLSNGRVMLGVGVGWMREEFETVGVPFEGRGARADEYIAAMRELWNESEASFEGRFVSFKRLQQHPKPLTRIPIIIGGHTPAAARRAGRLGDGFYPYVTDTGVLLPLLATMREAAIEAGRDPAVIEVTVPSPRERSDVQALEEHGVARVVLPSQGIGLTVAEAIGKLERYAARMF